jgi:SAM-dependent methyltransferase
VEPSGPNAQQISYWNEQAGPRWVAVSDRLDTQIEPLGELAIERSDLREGERVLDVGCGCGATTLALARRVGRAGATLGIDVSAVMLERARQRAREAGVGNATFLLADAQTHAFDPGTCDLLYSRFGVMFFAEPPAAFANLRRALRPGGRLTFVCWQPLARNPWMLVPLQAAARHVAFPPPPPPDTPGPFAFGDDTRVRALLEQAGFDEVAFEPAERELSLGGARSLEEAVEFLMNVGPAAAALREAAPDDRAAAEVAVAEALAPHVDESGVRLPGAVWIVTGRTR